MGIGDCIVRFKVNCDLIRTCCEEGIDIELWIIQHQVDIKEEFESVRIALTVWTETQVGTSDHP